MFQVTWHHPYLHVYVSSTTNEKRFDPSQCGTGSSGRLESWVSKCHWPSLNPMVYHHFPIKIDMKWRLIHHFFIDKPILYCCLYCCIMLYHVVSTSQPECECQVFGLSAARKHFQTSLPLTDRKVPKTISPGSCWKESKMEGLKLETYLPSSTTC